MARFRGIIRGQRGEASRLGSASSGLRVEAQSWQGKVTVHLYAKGDRDMVRVEFDYHNGAGSRGVIYDGPVSGAHVTAEMLESHPDARQPGETVTAHLARIAVGSGPTEVDA